MTNLSNACSSSKPGEITDVDIIIHPSILKRTWKRSGWNFSVRCDNICRMPLQIFLVSLASFQFNPFWWKFSVSLWVTMSDSGWMCSGWRVPYLRCKGTRIVMALAIRGTYSMCTPSKWTLNWSAWLRKANHRKHFEEVAVTKLVGHYQCDWKLMWLRSATHCVTLSQFLDYWFQLSLVSCQIILCL